MKSSEYLAGMRCAFRIMATVCRQQGGEDADVYLLDMAKDDDERLSRLAESQERNDRMRELRDTVRQMVKP